MGEEQLIHAANMRCAVCEGRIRLRLPTPDRSTCTHNCPRAEHYHARCDVCSPVGWFAISKPVARA